jgi:MEMO1 family protein
MNKYFIICILLSLRIALFSQTGKIRTWTDTIGFSHTARQTDSILARIERVQKRQISAPATLPRTWKTVICPHDDYTYAGYLYPVALSDVKAKTVIIFGVAHKAKLLKLENKIVFDSFDAWRAPYGNIKIPALREEIMGALPNEMYVVNDSMQKIEHSVEAIIPFLQYYNPKVQIISILVPYMSFARMDSLSRTLAKTIQKTLIKNKLDWGKDVAIVISNDAVHYGDTDWGGRNFARYGADSVGYKAAVEFERSLISSTLEGDLSPGKIKEFNANTVSDKDFHEYKWTWCGRYSVPFGLLTSYYLNQSSKQPLRGKLFGYSTSIHNKHIPVSDLGMGITAPANIRHWVGYAVVKFK